VRSIGDARAQIHRHLSDSSQDLKSANAFPKRLSDELELVKLGFSKNPIISGEGVSFHMVLRSSVPAKIKDVSILFHSSLGSRVAILDLRSSEIDNQLYPELDWTIDGHIAALDFVEGAYPIGLYVNCGNTRGDSLDLLQLDILAPETKESFTPYAPHDRGVLNLTYSFRSGSSHCQR
jgi:hypothetical protein